MHRALPGATRFRQLPFIHRTTSDYWPLRPCGEQVSSYGWNGDDIGIPWRARSTGCGGHAYTGLRPEFFGAYAGRLLLTGESRGYRGARFDRTSSRAGRRGRDRRLPIIFDRSSRYESQGASVGSRRAAESLIWIPPNMSLLSNYRGSAMTSALQATAVTGI